jgi:hypothetical protein
MSMVVKSHPAFFLAARTDHAAGPPAGSPSPPCALPEHSFPAAPCHGGKALPVGWRVWRSGRQARTTVYPCGTGHGPKHLVPYTPRASGTPSTRAHPSNERCPPRVTRRHSGGSLRLPLLPPAVQKRREQLPGHCHLDATTKKTRQGTFLLAVASARALSSTRRFARGIRLRRFGSGRA